MSVLTLDGAVKTSLHNMGQQVRIAVAGAGQIGVRHIEEIHRCTGAELAAIVDVSPAAGAIATAEGVALYDSLGALFAAGKPNGVIVATPNHLHVEQSLECIDAGVSVLVEKPIAHTLEEGMRLVAAVEASGATLLAGHSRPHSPILQKAVETVRSGKLGSIVGVVGTAIFYKPREYFEGDFAWRKEPGGGPILINMVHEVGNLRAMVGEIVAVQAFSSNQTRNFAVEDTAVINLRFENGALGSFMLSDTAASARSWEQTSQENKAYATYPDEDAYLVVGSKGSLSVPTMRLKYYERDEDRSWWKPFATGVEEVERADPLARQIAHFAAVIRGEEKPLVTGRDGLQNLRVVDAIIKASSAGGTVEVPLG